MSKHQTRRSISLRGTSYAALKARCEADDVAMSAIVEGLVARYLAPLVRVEAAPRSDHATDAHSYAVADWMKIRPVAGTPRPKLRPLAETRQPVIVALPPGVSLETAQRVIGKRAPVPGSTGHHRARGNRAPAATYRRSTAVENARQGAAEARPARTVPCPGCGFLRCIGLGCPGKRGQPARANAAAPVVTGTCAAPANARPAPAPPADRCGATRTGGEPCEARATRNGRCQVHPPAPRRVGPAPVKATIAAPRMPNGGGLVSF